MKKFILGLFFTFSIIAGAQTPSNNLNYVKLLKAPPIGQAKDSVLVFDSADGYMKMRPQSTLSAAKATSAKSGTVKTDITQADPLVYTKTTTDALLDIKAENSAGAISGFAITDNGNGTVNIASGFALLRATNSETGILQKYAIAAITNLTLTDNANNYVLANYNSGNPTLTVTTDPTQINGKTTTIVYVIARVGNTLHYLNLSGANVDSNGKLRARFLNTEAIKRAQGMTIGFANRNISVTAGLSYSGLIPIQTTAFNTVTGDTFTNAYNNGSVWARQASQTQINNTQYNLNGVLTTMPNNSFRTDYIYVLANNPSKLYVVMGGTSATLTAARAAGVPSVLPTELQYLGVLVGRTIIAKDAAAITESSSAFETVFANNGVQNHNDLAGLQGGAVGDYQHITETDRANWNGKFNTPTGLTTNYLPKWNGSAFGNSGVESDAQGNIVVNGGAGADTVFLNKPSGASIGFSSNNGQTNKTIIGSTNEATPAMYFYVNNAERVRITPSGNTIIGGLVDNLESRLQVIGNISALPAVTPNQVVVKSQLDAVAGTSGTYTPTIASVLNCSSLSIPSSATYTKIGNIVTAVLKFSLQDITANTNVQFKMSLPFNRATTLGNIFIGSGIVSTGSSQTIDVRFNLGDSSNIIANYISGTGTGNKTGVLTIQYDITQ